VAKQNRNERNLKTLKDDGEEAREEAKTFFHHCHSKLDARGEGTRRTKKGREGRKRRRTSRKKRDKTRLCIMHT
jgi:hypothetical protein